MRRPIKPFAVEVRRSSRKTAAPGQTDSPEESSQPADIDAGAVRRPPEDSDQGYLAALRAADALFGSAAPGTAAPRSESRPSWPPADFDPQSQPRNAATLAAEEMFRPVPQAEPAAGRAPQPSFDAPAGTGRILQSLNERDPLQERLADEELAERDAGPRAPRQRDPLRSRSSEVRRLPIPAPELPAEADDSAPDEQPARPQGDRTRLPGYVRGSIYARWVTGKSTRPGENWKKRRTKSVT